MGWVVVIVLLIAIVVFGAASSAQSYATARQAQAQIEVARVAQTQAWTNLISVMVMAVLILLILFALVAFIILAIRFMQVRAETAPLRLYPPRRVTLPSEPQRRALLPPGTNETNELDDLTPDEIELIERILEGSL